MMTTLAGRNSGLLDGIGTNAQFLYPQAAVVDTLGTIYVADYGNNRIRKVLSSGWIFLYHLKEIEKNSFNFYCDSLM